MIIVTDPMRPFLFTPKGTIRRQLMLKDYQADIARLYQENENSSTDEIPLPESRSLAECTAYMGKVVQSLLGRKAGFDEDIFQLGADRYGLSLWNETNMLIQSKSPSYLYS